MHDEYYTNTLIILVFIAYDLTPTTVVCSCERLFHDGDWELKCFSQRFECRHPALRHRLLSDDTLVERTPMMLGASALLVTQDPTRKMPTASAESLVIRL
jgi:hypothetical protein